MRKKVSIALSVALYCTFASALCAAQPELATADWSVNAPRSLAKYPPSDDAVQAFFANVNEEPDALICSFQFANLRRTGPLSLAVSVGERRGCDLMIIDKVGSHFDIEGFPLAYGAEIEDLKGDGNLELIADTAFTEYGGANHCVATWPVIYAWTGGKYTDVSRQYPEYYRQQLALIKQAIAAAEAGPIATPTPERRPRQRNIPLAGTVSNPADYQRQLPAPEAPPPEPTAAPTASNPYEVRGIMDCVQAEQGKIERFLGDKDAGMTDAIRWADSDNVNQRLFAIDVLNDIGSPDAIEYLKTLTRDSHRTVATSARLTLRFRSQAAAARAKSGGSEK